MLIKKRPSFQEKESKEKSEKAKLIKERAGHM